MKRGARGEISAPSRVFEQTLVIYLDVDAIGQIVLNYNVLQQAYTISVSSFQIEPNEIGFVHSRVDVIDKLEQCVLCIIPVVVVNVNAAVVVNQVDFEPTVAIVQTLDAALGMIIAVNLGFASVMP